MVSYLKPWNEAEKLRPLDESLPLLNGTAYFINFQRFVMAGFVFVIAIARLFPKLPWSGNKAKGLFGLRDKLSAAHLSIQHSKGFTLFFLLIRKLC